MDLADHVKKFGIIYLVGAILISGTIATFVILSKQPKSGGGKGTDERFALDHNKDSDKVQLWEGGPYWATKNIGAENPWEYGYYFWWGDTVGYKRQGDVLVASDGSSKDFKFEHPPTSGKNRATLQREGWITDDGVLVPKYDAAQVQWGGEWRLPTRRELNSLRKKCSWTRAKQNGVDGYVIRGRGDYASASIFLPCAGGGDGASLNNVGSGGFYWSSVSSPGGYGSWGLCFGPDDPDLLSYLRYGRYTIRPVRGPTILAKQPRFGGGKATGERVALGHKKAHKANSGKVQLWEGGPYWADRNVGAEDPWGYGYYFWWGDTVGYKFEDGEWVASDGSSTDFGFWEETTPTIRKIPPKLQSEGWITADGVLAPKHDAAQVHWGDGWRMPTAQERADLCEKCDWIGARMHGVNGFVVRGRGNYASASIFLPCAGYGIGTTLDHVGSYGGYWASVPYSDTSGSSWSLYCNPSEHLTDSKDRAYGQSVRPVQGVTK